MLRQRRYDPVEGPLRRDSRGLATLSNSKCFCAFLPGLRCRGPEGWRSNPRSNTPCSPFLLDFVTIKWDQATGDQAFKASLERIHGAGEESASYEMMGINYNPVGIS